MGTTVSIILWAIRTKCMPLNVNCNCWFNHTDQETDSMGHMKGTLKDGLGLRILCFHNAKMHFYLLIYSICINYFCSAMFISKTVDKNPIFSNLVLEHLQNWNTYRIATQKSLQYGEDPADAPSLVNTPSHITKHWEAYRLVMVSMSKHTVGTLLLQCWWNL